MNDCKELIAPEIESALDSFEIRSSPTGCEVVTPFQHSDGDLISLWIENRAGSLYNIRDYGETFGRLQLYGVDPGSDSRQERIGYIKKQFNLQSVAGEIILKTEKGNLGYRLFDAIQAIEAISHLVYTHQSRYPSLFKNEVEDYIEQSGYSYAIDFIVQGSTQQRDFDIAINHRSPAVLLDTIHTNDVYDLRNKVDSIMLNWYEIREKDYQHGAIIDDVNGLFKESDLRSLIDNLDYFFRWTEKDRISQQIPLAV